MPVVCCLQAVISNRAQNVKKVFDREEVISIRVAAIALTFKANHCLCVSSGKTASTNGQSYITGVLIPLKRVDIGPEQAEVSIPVP